MQPAAEGFIIFVIFFGLFCAFLLYWENRCRWKRVAYLDSLAENPGSIRSGNAAGEGEE
jgi:hypothetical protein